MNDGFFFDKGLYLWFFFDFLGDVVGDRKKM